MQQTWCPLRAAGSMSFCDVSLAEVIAGEKSSTCTNSGTAATEAVSCEARVFTRIVGIVCQSSSPQARLTPSTTLITRR